MTATAAIEKKPSECDDCGAPLVDDEEHECKPEDRIRRLEGEVETLEVERSKLQAEIDEGEDPEKLQERIDGMVTVLEAVIDACPDCGTATIRCPRCRVLEMLVVEEDPDLYAQSGITATDILGLEPRFSRLPPGAPSRGALAADFS